MPGTARSRGAYAAGPHTRRPRRARGAARARCASTRPAGVRASIAAASPTARPCGQSPPAASRRGARSCGRTGPGRCVSGATYRSACSGVAIVGWSRRCRRRARHTLAGTSKTRSVVVSAMDARRSRARRSQSARCRSSAFVRSMITECPAASSARARASTCLRRPSSSWLHRVHVCVSPAHVRPARPRWPLARLCERLDVHVDFPLPISYGKRSNVRHTARPCAGAAARAAAARAAAARAAPWPVPRAWRVEERGYLRELALDLA